MADIRGRPFAFVVLTLSLWIGSRIMMSQDNDAVQLAVLPKMPQEPVTVAQTTASLSMPQKMGAGPPSRRHRPRQITTNFGLTSAQDPVQNGGRLSGLQVPLWVAESSKPQSAGRDTPPSKALALTGEAGQPEQKLPERRRWGGEVYAYSFWRLSTGSETALAPGAQYGGSQSGIIATIDPFGLPDRGLSLLARGSMTPDGDEREIALGLRWRPNRDWPLTLSAERLFRANAPDRFAAYLAGGVDQQPIAGSWKLNAFGQAGYATGQSGGAFFDAQARMLHPLAKIGGIPMSAGIGSWAGGQKGAARLDIGPTVAAKVDTGSASLLIQLDWRLRAAGNAAPRNGLALTVSTGF